MTGLTLATRGYILPPLEYTFVESGIDENFSGPTITAVQELQPATLSGKSVKPGTTVDNLDTPQMSADEVKPEVDATSLKPTIIDPTEC